LIELCHAAGDRARALRAYHVCVSTLERELGIDPAPATRVIYEAVLDAAPGGAAATRGTSPFVGRVDELRRLRTVWRESAARRAQLVLVSGEPGVGKTRLLDELRVRAEAVTVEARAYAAEGPIAYGLATAWLRSRRVAARLSRLEHAQLTDLARLLPELSGQVPSPEPLPEPELRRRLFAAIGHALLAAGSPLLLIADDLHWADEQSLRLIHYLLRAAPSARLLVAATARREELDEQHPLGRLARRCRPASASPRSSYGGSTAPRRHSSPRPSAAWRSRVASLTGSTATARGIRCSSSRRSGPMLRRPQQRCRR
jgi:hypothetical protein